MNNQESKRGVDTRASQRTLSARERYEFDKEAFLAVTTAYVRKRQLSPVVSMNLDPTPGVTSKRLTPDDITYCVDCERATEYALNGRIDLQTGWFALVAGETVPANVARQVIERCGRLYRARNLQPWRYFAKVTR